MVRSSSLIKPILPALPLLLTLACGDAEQTPATAQAPEETTMPDAGTAPVTEDRPQDEAPDDAEPIPAPVRIDGDNVILLRPPVYTPDADMVVIVPGAGVEAERYLSLAEAIYRARGETWTAVVRFPFDSPNPVQIAGRVEEAVKLARSELFASSGTSRIYIAGHSLGGIFAKDVANRNEYAGLILLASYLAELPGNAPISEYAKPLLSVAGDRDGFTRVTRVAEEIVKLDEEFDRLDAHCTDKAVVVVPGADHYSFVDDADVAGDFGQSISLESAQTTMAAHIDDFLRAQRGEPDAEQAICDAVAATRTALAPYLNARELDDGQWCGEAQRMVAGELAGDIEVRVEPRSNVAALASNYPAIENAESGAKVVVTQALSSYPWNLGDARPTLVSPTTSCKLKSRASIYAAFDQVAADETTCQAINEAALAWAYDALSDDAKRRYEANGRQLVFGEDLPKSTGPTFLAASLTFEADGDVQNVQSPTLYTNEDAWVGPKGNFYCTLMPPSRAVEWLLVGGFVP